MLAERSGEIIPNYGLRDTEKSLGRELVISGYGRRDHGAGIGLGDIYLFSDLTSSTSRYETIYETFDILCSSICLLRYFWHARVFSKTITYYASSFLYINCWG